MCLLTMLCNNMRTLLFSPLENARFEETRVLSKVYSPTIWPYFDRQGVCNFFGIRLRYCPFSEKFCIPVFHHQGIQQMLFPRQFSDGSFNFFLPFLISWKCLSTNCLLWFPQKGPPTQAKRAHREREGYKKKQ